MAHRPHVPGNAVLLLSLVLSSLCPGTGCRAPFRTPVEPYDATRPVEAILRDGMNPYLLTNVVSHRVVVEVDRISGAAFDPEALEALRETLVRHAAPGKEVEFVLDDEIPAEVWHQTEGGFLDRARQLGPFVDWFGERDSELIYVVYVPDEPEFMGWAQRLVLEIDGEPQPVDTILIFPATFDRAAELWITRRKIERAILVHELGHVLGLVSGPDHRERDNPRHCTEPQCVMTHPSARSKTYNALPSLFAGKVRHEYCNRCRADIETVRRSWYADDPTELAEELRRRREIDTLRARACWFGRQRRFGEALAAVREARELAGVPDAAAPAEDVRILTELCPAGEGRRAAGLRPERGGARISPTPACRTARGPSR